MTVYERDEGFLVSGLQSLEEVQILIRSLRAVSGPVGAQLDPGHFLRVSLVVASVGTAHGRYRAHRQLPSAQEVAIPSPPTAFGTVTEPTIVSDPPVPTWNSSTMPLAPVCTYR